MTKVRCTISFMDGGQLKFAWERAEDAAIRAGSLVEKLTMSQSLAIELEGRLIIVPTQNVRTIEVLPAPESLPPTAIRNAHIIAEA
jgi:hypothetical protein